MPIPGTLIEFQIKGFDNLSYINLGTGFVQSVYQNKNSQTMVRVYIFNKTKYNKKNLSEVVIGSIEENYSIEDFFTFFKIIS